MNLKIYSVVIFFFFVGVLRAEDNFLSKDISDAIENDSVKEDVIRGETESLNIQLEEIRDRLQKVEDEKSNLQAQLREYKSKEDLQISRESKIAALKQIITEEPFVIKDIEDGDYNFAYQAIILGNIDKAEEYLVLFLKKEFKNNAGGDQELQKEYLYNISKLKNKANYLIGAIKLIRLDPTGAIVYLANAYRDSDQGDVVLLSLLKLAEAFNDLKKSQEVCLTLTRVYSTVNQIQNIDENFVLSSENAKFIANLEKSNNCNFKKPNANSTESNTNQIKEEQSRDKDLGILQGQNQNSSGEDIVSSSSKTSPVAKSSTISKEEGSNQGVKQNHEEGSGQKVSPNVDLKGIPLKRANLDGNQESGANVAGQNNMEESPVLGQGFIDN